VQVIHNQPLKKWVIDKRYCFAIFWYYLFSKRILRFLHIDTKSTIITIQVDQELFFL